MTIFCLIVLATSIPFALMKRLGNIYVDSDFAPPQRFVQQNFCSNDGPVSFRRRPDAGIPHCLSPPGPAKGCVLININIYSSIPYQCPNKAYVCGYSNVPNDIEGNVVVRCCSGALVTYDDRECVWYFRAEDPRYPSPTKPGYFLVGSTPIFLPRGAVGFYNRECPYRRTKVQRRLKTMY